MKTRWQTWLAAAALLFFAAIIILADQHTLPGLITNLYDFPYGDKLGHFCLMGGLSFCLNLALRSRPVRLLNRPFLLGSLLIAGIVTVEEISQAFIPARTFDLLDLAASLAGIVVLGRTVGLLSILSRKHHLPV